MWASWYFCFFFILVSQSVHEGMSMNFEEGGHHVQLHAHSKDGQKVKVHKTGPNKAELIGGNDGGQGSSSSSGNSKKSKGTAKKALSSVGGVAKSAGETGVHTVKHVAKSLESTASSLGGNVIKDVEKMGHKMENMVSKAAQMMKQAVKDVGNVVNGAVSGAGSAVTTVANKVVNTAQNTASNAENAMSSATQKMKEGLNKVRMSITNALNQLFQMIIKASGNVEQGSGKMSKMLKDLQQKIKKKVNQFTDYISQPQEKAYALVRRLIRNTFMNIENGMVGIEQGVNKLGGEMDDLSRKAGTCVTQHSEDIPKHVYKNIASCLTSKVNQVINVGSKISNDIKLGGKLVNTAVSDMKKCKKAACVGKAAVTVAKQGGKTMFKIVTTVANVGMFAGTLVPSIPLCFGQQVGLKTPLQLGSMVFNIGKCVVQK